MVIWPEFAATFAVFEAMATQWSTENGVKKGLRYELIETVSRLLDIDASEVDFNDLRIMELKEMDVSYQRMKRARDKRK